MSLKWQRGRVANAAEGHFPKAGEAPTHGGAFSSARVRHPPPPPHPPGPLNYQGSMATGHT